MKILKERIDENKGRKKNEVKDMMLVETLEESDEYVEESDDTLAEDSGSNTSLLDNKIDLTEKTVWSDVFLHNITNTC